MEHLRILDCNNEKTKTKLVDLKNMIEFYRRQVHDDNSSDDNTDSDDDLSENGTIVGDNATSDTISDDDDI